jgi:16S rRNA (cytosine967-C5)-methyltransferase
VTPSDIEHLVELQARLLEQSASLVRVGGRVVYSTCTIGRAENEDVVGAFLAASGGRFEPRDLTAQVPDAWREDVTADGWFQSTPVSGGPDGHFVAVLERVV